jgi:hypothetical protein
VLAFGGGVDRCGPNSNTHSAYPSGGLTALAAGDTDSGHLGGAPTQPLEVGRTTRVIQATQRTALAVRDGGCVFPGCQRPLAWCEAHHLRHWLHGGPPTFQPGPVVPGSSSGGA